MSGFTFDPDHVAKLETEMWRSYYDRKWLRVLYLTERTSAEEFHIPIPLSLQAAYYATRAARAFKPIDNDLPATLGALTGYYRLVRRFSGLRFDPAEVAGSELRYWIVHRDLSGASDHAALIDVLAELHASTFGIPRERALDSGRWRAKAAITVDGITGRRSTDVDRDWGILEDQLRSCYRSLAREIGPAGAP
jgi:hypothetical protein